MAKAEAKKSTASKVATTKKAAKKKTAKKTASKTTAKKAAPKKKAAKKTAAKKSSAATRHSMSADEKRMMVALHAYYKWEKAGFPTGQDFQHWIDAEREVEAMLKG